jgi:hypothetical protein
VGNHTSLHPVSAQKPIQDLSTTLSTYPQEDRTMNEPISPMAYLGKPLNFRQQMLLDYYLTTYQEFVINQVEELAQLLDEISAEVSQFLTEEELKKLDDLIELPQDKKPLEVIEIGIQLAKGMKADEYHVAEMDTKIDISNGIIYFTGIISPKPPETLFEDLEH